MLPQVEEVLEDFPLIQAKEADAAQIPELAGFLSIFTAPVLILFADGKEMQRDARFVHIEEFREKTRKLYEGYYSQYEQ
ncbi:thioredoxin family protein [Planococcus sp. 1R117A]|uniref:thioredoxin family protein n=1 Tax=Planococcus sp. 1R117A TaxID=3447020 RepID=UPI003EDC8D59